jgi:hypothetical protein
MSTRVFSKRGNELVVSDVLYGDTVTCELYSKWYELWIVAEDSRIPPRPLPFDELEPFAATLGESAYNDHVPNPKAVVLFALAHGLYVDDLAFEIMVGRWHTEARHEYDAFWEAVDEGKV